MSNKNYKRALDLYNKGNINKAIEICEREISRGLSNSKFLNLKALLLYLKGNLEDSKALWKINRDYNDDEIAKSYLKYIEDDFNKEKLYKESEELIKKLAIDEAINILKICSESDFNTINVNNSLADCYLKKGNSEKAKEHIEKVFRLDKENKEASIIHKQLNSLYKENNSIKKFFKSIMATLVIVTLILILFLNKDIISYKLKMEWDKVNNYLEDDNKFQEDVNKFVDENQKFVDENDEVKNSFIEEKEIEVLSDEKIKENYIKASDYYENAKYKEAKSLLEETIKRSKNNHLEDDIIFLLASSYEAYGDTNKAIEIYDKYILNYKEGSYIEEAYYKGALLYRNIDISISKKYANEILINYPTSIYNNSYIEEIINS